MDRENAPSGSRFFVGAIIGAVVGALVAGLIVVSLGDPQRIYVTEKVDTAEAVADALDNQAPVTTIALDAETVSDRATTPEVEKTDAGRLDVKAVLAAVAPTVVQIEVSSKDGIFGGGQGTGFIISSDGQVVTNAHVVEGASSIKVMLSDGTLKIAELVQ